MVLAIGFAVERLVSNQGNSALFLEWSCSGLVADLVLGQAGLLILRMGNDVIFLNVVIQIRIPVLSR